MPAAPFTIAPAVTRDDVAAVTDLFREYGESHRTDLSFQRFNEELSGMPGDYAEPRGALLLARVGDAAAGCVGLRALAPATCEMKRLYVRPAYRGMKIGDALAHAIIDGARTRGYTSMRLDTLPSMTGARRLYAQLGFREIPPYRFNPVEGTAFLELALR